MVELVQTYRWSQSKWMDSSIQRKDCQEIIKQNIYRAYSQNIKIQNVESKIMKKYIVGKYQNEAIF